MLEGRLISPLYSLKIDVIFKIINEFVIDHY
jgi:hypothetical protein